jgi:hypothetical protein
VALGLAIVQLGKDGDTRFTNSPEFLLWSALVAVGIAVWLAMGVGMLDTVRELAGLFRDGRPAIPVGGLFAVYAVYGAGLFAVLAFVNAGPALPLNHFTVRTRLILALGLLSAAPTVVTLWLVAERLRHLRPLLATAAAPSPLPDPGARVEELRTLWRCSVRSLAAASVTVSFAVLMAGSLRNALLAYDRPRYAEQFPVVALLIYGSFFTVAFAAVYMPTLLSWRARARQLVDVIYRTPDDGKPDENWMKGRTTLEQLLGINIGVMAQLSGMLAIFGPLVTSFLAGFVPQLAP